LTIVRLGVTDDDQFPELRRHLAIRPLLDALFPPAPEILAPPDDATIVCRCEEVTAGDIRAAVALGAPGPNQLKAFTRCGMGPCQGRICGLTVAETIAAARGLPVEDIGYYRIRPPIKPVTLGELAALDG
ncbi:MAG: (2Fe-2S)-binding protein, partial [Alphaproteobacteria bacterium]